MVDSSETSARSMMRRTVRTEKRISHEKDIELYRIDRDAGDFFSGLSSRGLHRTGYRLLVF